MTECLTIIFLFSGKSSVIAINIGTVPIGSSIEKSKKKASINKVTLNTKMDSMDTIASSY